MNNADEKKGETVEEIARYTPATKQSVLLSLTPDEIANIGYIECDEESVENYFAVVSFSETNYWYDSGSLKPYIYDSNSNLYQYVENYKNILEEDYNAIIDDARLLSYQEAIALGCDGEESTCLTSTILSNNRSFIFDTSFWMGSLDYAVYPWYVSGEGGLHSDICTSSLRALRPVISVPKSTFE